MSDQGFRMERNMVDVRRLRPNRWGLARDRFDFCRKVGMPGVGWPLHLRAEKNLPLNLNLAPILTFCDMRSSVIKQEYFILTHSSSVA